MFFYSVSSFLISCFENFARFCSIEVFFQVSILILFLSFLLLNYFVLLKFYESFVGIYEATSLDRYKKDALHTRNISEGSLDDQIQMPSLPT